MEGNRMRQLFQFGLILAFCFLGEVLRCLLPLPLPAGVCGMLLLFLALSLGLVKVSRVKQAASFLTGLFPLLFIPAVAGVMVQGEELQKMLPAVLIAATLNTLLVMGVTGRVAQRLMRKRGQKDA